MQVNQINYIFDGPHKVCTQRYTVEKIGRISATVHQSAAYSQKDVNRLPFSSLQSPGLSQKFRNVQLR